MAGTFVEHVNQLAADLTAQLILNITDVAAIKGNVSTVAGDSAAINAIVAQIIPNLAEILLADNNAATATVQAGISTTQAGFSAASAAAALLSEQNAALSYDQFDDRYLGSKAVAPILDNDGNALLVGALYFDTVTNKIRVWDGALWSDALILTAGSISTMTNKVLDDITNSVGANHVHHEVRNASGTTIAQGTVVTAQGIQSGTDYIEVVPLTDNQTQVAIGITHTAILNNGTGLVLNTGMSGDFTNTNIWPVGTILYVGTTGGFTDVRPTAGQYQACAVVLRQHNTQGRLLVEFTEPKHIASTTQQGYTQLNNTLTSTSTVQALTAVQGKVLNDALAGKQATLTFDTVPTNGSTNPVESNGIFDAIAAKADAANLANYLALSGGDMTGTIREAYAAIAASDIAVSTASVFSKTISGATTFTLSSIPLSPKVSGFTLELTNGGSAVVTWWAGIKWTGGIAPTLTAAGLDILEFYTRDGGTTWRGFVSSKDNK